MSKAIKRIGRAVGSVAKAVVNVVQKVAPIAAPILSVVAPGIGTAIGTALGASAAAAPIVGSAVLGATGSAIAGQNPIVGAALGGGSAYLKGLLSPSVAAGVPDFGSTAADQAFIAADAAQLAKQGLSSSAIAQNLQFAGINPFLAADAAQLAAQGLSQSAIAQNRAQSASPLGVSPTWSVQSAAKAATGLGGLGINPLSALSALGRPQQQAVIPQAGAGTAGLLGQVDYSTLLGLLGTGRAARSEISSLLA